ncbi:hypothetical protein DBV08_05775 [Rhodococcus sp. KBW08]|uniref:DUF6924 domain-containing protein n=1 Tax=Rhodococcus sp. KBW08 TaxID=2144188 RepID=UPI000F599930|nr:hypothetical protein [Rhodococcus sp. KBW08]RQO50024.1 hypothetical protein DBV08_05775 [Rhodococcus sp. KBW08]
MTFPDVEVPLFRLDYSDDQTWHKVVREALGPASDRTDPLTIVESPEFNGIDIDELLARLNEDDPGYQFFVVADASTLVDADHPFTVIAAANPPGRLPVSAHTLSDVVANLWISNLDFEDYSAAADSDGVYRATQPQLTEPEEQMTEVDDIIEAMGDGPWPGALEEFRVGLLDYRARAGFRVFTSLVDARRVYEISSERPISAYSKYWDVYGHDEYLDALREGGQLLAFRFDLMTGHRDNHWSAILDPSSLRVLGAERWIKHSS